MGKGRVAKELNMPEKPLFFNKEQLLHISDLSLDSIYRRIRLGELYAIKNGHQLIILNPGSDFEKPWDALPALLSYQEVCDFFCTDHLCEKLMHQIGFFSLAQEERENEKDEFFVDKKSLGGFLKMIVGQD